MSIGSAYEEKAMAIKQDIEIQQEPQQREDLRETDIMVKPDGDWAEQRRKRELLRKFAARLNAEAPGITPNWQRVIDNYKRLSAERVPE